MTPTNPPEWFQTVVDLVANGAEIDIANSDDTSHHWPLARHTRHDTDEAIVWLRPLTGPAPDGTRFTHDQARRHGLAYTDATANYDGTVTFTTPAGQTIHIRPITNQLAPLLDSFDTFTGWVLDAADEAQLDRLAEDSW